MNYRIIIKYTMNNWTEIKLQILKITIDGEKDQINDIGAKKFILTYSGKKPL